MENVNCVVCSSARSVPFMEKDSFKIVRCADCSMVYVTPRLTFAELTEFYDINYFEYVDSYDNDLQRRKGAISWIHKYKKTGKLLDIGCSIGSMLDAAAPYFDATGIDIADWALQKAEQRGFTVINGTLEDIKFPDATFDVITFTEVIEHVHDPKAFLNEVHRILKPGGIVYITTGNVEGWRAKKDGINWYYLTPKYHLSFFSPKTIRKILKLTNFEVREIGGLFRFRDMFPLWRSYSNKLAFIKACIGKISFADFTFGDMGIIARKPE